MSSMALALYIGGSLLVYWAVSVLLDDGGPAARRRRSGVAATAQSPVSTSAAPLPLPPGSEIAPAWHAVLGVPEDASRARILAAYRELVMREHPDPRLPLSAEQRARAEARLQEIEAACNAGLAAAPP